MKNHPNLKKRIASISFVLINIAVVAVLAFSEFGKTQTGPLPAVRFNVVYLICLLGCFAVAMLSETVKYYLMMKRFRADSSLHDAFEVAAYGKYYDNITPFGAGGQPFQAIYLKNKGFSGGHCASLPIAGFLNLQLAFLLLAAVVFVFGKWAMPLVGVRVAAYVGMAFYLFLPLLILLFAVAPAALTSCIGFFVRLCGRLHLVRDPEKTMERTVSGLSEYRESLKELLGVRMLLTETFLLSLLYQICICAMPYFALHAFGSTAGFLQLFCVTVFIYSAITFIPTPGNSGAAEGSFYTVFSTLSGGSLFWAMLVWRFFCYYLFLLIGLWLQVKKIFKRGKKSSER